MGAWGYKNFENDTAMEWVNMFRTQNSKEIILKKVFDAILQATDFIDSNESFEALAAAEVVAAINGRQSKDFPENWSLENIKSDDFIKIAAKNSVDKIINFVHHSELRELWKDSDEYEEWLLVEKNLIERLL